MIKKWIALLLAGAMMAAISGCFFAREQQSSSSLGAESSQAQSSQEEKPDPSTPAGATATLLEALKTLDVQTVNQYTYSDQYNQMFGEEELQGALRELCEQLFGAMTYEVGQETIQGDSATVQVTVTNVDLSGVMPKLMTNVAAAALTGGDGELDYLQLLTDLLEEEIAAGKTKTTEAELNLQKRDGVWKVEQNVALADLLTGGMFSSIKSLAESVLGQVESLEDLLNKLGQ